MSWRPFEESGSLMPCVNEIKHVTENHLPFNPAQLLVLSEIATVEGP